MLGSPKWHEGLLKLAKVHLNEIAIMPAMRNHFHEFCHSEVPTLTAPERRRGVLVFAGSAKDD
ncbi:hypothetical protein V1J52_24715 [Streptomyces sp. TRM 70351]|uniref:hypothetical protein n=1 Tax=Streptomyces sp. TRM 70351 TaxID=3116552 RepID=UPI002E7C1C81|nr:hypothetical protein [Streptomyces sp. TRM 70351]MEE1931326.1 hypothetical protein [Streptomyces sp. TRM 70351]